MNNVVLLGAEMKMLADSSIEIGHSLTLMHTCLKPET